MLVQMFPSNPFEISASNESSAGDFFENCDEKTVLVGDALAHEGRAIVLAGMILRQSDYGFQDMRNLVGGMVAPDTAVPNRGSYRSWILRSMLPPGLVEETGDCKYSPTRKGLEALPLAGALFELSERYGKSLLVTTGKPQGNGGIVFARRIGAIRMAFRALEKDQGAVSLESVRDALDLSNTGESLDYMKRLSQTALYSLDTSTITTETLFEAGDSIGMLPAKHAGALQKKFVDRFRAYPRSTFDELLAVAQDELGMDESVDVRSKVRMTLNAMEERGQIQKVAGRFSDRHAYLEATPKQMEYMSDILKILDLYAQREPVFLQRYGRHALDVCADEDRVGRILTRALEANGRQNKSVVYADDCVVKVLKEAAGKPLCTTDITKTITNAFENGIFPKPVSVITIRKSLQRLSGLGAITVHASKSNAHSYSFAP